MVIDSGASQNKPMTVFRVEMNNIRTEQWESEKDRGHQS